MQTFFCERISQLKSKRHGGDSPHVHVPSFARRSNRVASEQNAFGGPQQPRSVLRCGSLHSPLASKLARFAEASALFSSASDTPPAGSPVACGSSAAATVDDAASVNLPRTKILRPPSNHP